MPTKDDRGACLNCGNDLGIGFGMGNVMKECRCRRALIWIPTLSGGHWEPLTKDHEDRMYKDFKDVLSSHSDLW
jgi:hypothetical protein